MELYQISFDYLKACGIKANKRFLQERVQSHPDYPSLISLTDTLEELQLEYLALEVDKDKIHNLLFPIIVHTTVNGGNFEIVFSLNQILNDIDFLERWDGVVLYVTPNAVIKNKQYKIFVLRKNQTIFFAYSLITIIFLFWLTLSIIVLNIPTFLFSLLNIAGICICTLIILHSLGMDNAITKQLCSADGTSGCDKVLTSKAVKIFKEADLGDIGLV